LQARITLARAVYSKAQVLLLDDILSALDVHTAQWIVDKCLGGDLISNRTVILVTHNVMLAKTVAHYLVALGQDGAVLSQGPVDRVLREKEVLKSVADIASLPQQDVKVDITITKGKNLVKSASGKLIIPEDMALDHHKWPGCQ
jgi:ABC-type nitrate/sulfonate/bicarbonate transport system ATPase subunit